MVRPIYDAKLDDLIAKTDFKLRGEVYYALTDKKFDKISYTVRGPSRITDFREWNGKLQIKLADNDSCWLYAKLCFLTHARCLQWVTDANNNKTLHGEIA